MTTLSFNVPKWTYKQILLGGDPFVDFFFHFLCMIYTLASAINYSCIEFELARDKINVLNVISQMFLMIATGHSFHNHM